METKSNEPKQQERKRIMMKEERPAIPQNGPMDYTKLTECINRLAEHYPDAVEVSYLGATILDRAIPVLSLGNPRASKSVIVIGGMGGGDSVTPALLLRFANDCCEFPATGRRLFSVNLPYLFEHRRILVVPMLNCDGCTIRQNGAGESILKERLLAMNGGNPSFAAWEANARGVDLRRNFTYGFGKGSNGNEGTGCPAGYCGTSPESEPETASLCNFIRMNGGTSLLLTLHMDGNSLTCPAAEPAEPPIPRLRTVSRLLSRMCGTPIEKKADTDGSAIDWFANEYRRPAFAIGCRYPDTSTAPDDYLNAYAYLREALFSAPLLV